MRISKLFLAVPLAVPLLVSPVYANEPATVDIPVTVEGTDTAKVVISSDNEEAMNAIQGETELVINKEGSFKVLYDEPVDYKYTIKQIDGASANNKGEKIIYDTSIYTAHVFVKAEDDGTLSPIVIAYPDGSTSKSETVGFKNKIEEKKKSSVNTGEGRDLMVDVLLLLSGIACMGFLLISKSYGKKRI